MENDRKLVLSVKHSIVFRSRFFGICSSPVRGAADVCLCYVSIRNRRVQAPDLHTRATVHLWRATVHPWVKVHLVSKFSTIGPQYTHRAKVHLTQQIFDLRHTLISKSQLIPSQQFVIISNAASAAGCQPHAYKQCRSRPGVHLSQQILHGSHTQLGPLSTRSLHLTHQFLGQHPPPTQFIYTVLHHSPGQGSPYSAGSRPKYISRTLWSTQRVQLVFQAKVQPGQYLPSQHYTSCNPRSLPLTLYTRLLLPLTLALTIIRAY